MHEYSLQLCSNESVLFSIRFQTLYDEPMSNVTIVCENY